MDEKSEKYSEVNTCQTDISYRDSCENRSHSELSSILEM